MIEIGLGGFIATIVGSFMVGGAIGIIITSCLAAGHSNDNNFDDEEE